MLQENVLAGGQCKSTFLYWSVCIYLFWYVNAYLYLFYSVPYPESKYVYDDITDDEHHYIKLNDENQVDIIRKLSHPILIPEEEDTERLITEEERLSIQSVH